VPNGGRAFALLSAHAARSPTTELAWHLVPGPLGGYPDLSEIGVEADPACLDDANRYVDRDNGTVTDIKTGLIWLKQAFCGALTFNSTFAAGSQLVAQLADGQCGLSDSSSPGDWRLPTKEEWEATWDTGCPSPTITDTTGTACFAAGSPFTNMPPAANRGFRSSTLDGADVSQYIVANLDNGTSFSFPRAAAPGFILWPVRDR